MIKKLLFLSFLAATASFGATLQPIDDNPGHVDDPAARALIVVTMKASDQNPDDFTIVYDKTVMMKDGKGAVNFYLVTNKKTGSVVEAAVAIHFEPQGASLPHIELPR